MGTLYLRKSFYSKTDGMQLKGCGSIRYFLQGDNPRLLIRSGSHGNEYEVIDAIKDIVRVNMNRLSDFVFIPEVSPSAVVRRTRMNERGIDINRSFIDEASDPETLANMEIARNYHFDLCVDFHEDLLVSGFYLYDSGLIEDEKLVSFKDKVSELSVELFTGVDDPEDPALAIKVADGYVPNSLEEMSPESGMFEIWAMRHNLLARCLVPEIPGKVPFLKKKELVELVFNELVL